MRRFCCFVMSVSMKVFISSILLLLSGVSSVCCVGTVKGSVGESVGINCVYPEEYELQSVYLKKIDGYIIIEILKSHGKTYTKGRYSLYHDTESRIITATIHNLNIEDAGTYICVPTSMDGNNEEEYLYTEFRLEVEQAPPTPTPPLTTSAHSSPTGDTLLSRDTGAGGICTHSEEGHLTFVFVRLVAAALCFALLHSASMLMRNRGKGKEEKGLDLESRSRRQNIRLIGIEEGKEGNNPRQFCAAALKEILDLEDTPRLDRGHRSLAPKPRDGERPRPFIIRVHHGDVKDRILRVSSQKKQLFYNEKRVHIFPDFAPEVAKKRAAFAEARQLLKGIKDVKFGLRFPAIFRVTFKGEEKSFTNPELAVSYIKDNILPSS
ncbi:uncharacterized protein LOC134070525 [Sardina pilchardus]|uniref:uncharacterized protein LOC134070525 n=1 Tax=Sardina pilchardus TaxID=27697 RepID=UPI002E13A7F4